MPYLLATGTSSQERETRRRVVLADDHPDVLRRVFAMLDPAFDVVATVSDGCSAVEAVHRLRPRRVAPRYRYAGDGWHTCGARVKAGRVCYQNHISQYAPGRGLRSCGLADRGQRLRFQEPDAFRFAISNRTHVPVVPLSRRLRAGTPHKEADFVWSSNPEKRRTSVSRDCLCGF